MKSPALTNEPDREREAFLVTEEHIKFIEDTSPAYVKHLDLLGIRPKTT